MPQRESKQLRPRKQKKLLAKLLQPLSNSKHSMPPLLLLSLHQSLLIQPLQPLLPPPRSFTQRCTASALKPSISLSSSSTSSNTAAYSQAKRTSSKPSLSLNSSASSYSKL
jgi:hypothetical protein